MTAESEAETRPGNEGDAVSPRAKFGIGTITVLLLAWFLFAWLVLDRHFLDAAGESVGTAFALGVIASVVAALRGSR